MKEEKVELEELRDEVAQTTKEIIRLIARRNGLARRIGIVKTKDALPIEDEKVEETLLREVLDECEKLGVSQEVGSRVFSVLVSESKRIQGRRAEKGSLVTPMGMLNKAMELSQKGVKLIRLDVGEPDFHPPKAVLEACSDALFSFKTHYTQTRGIPELVSALTSYLARRHRYKASEKQVMITPGGRFGVYAALATLVKEGEGCIVIDPNWPAYKEALQYIGARAATVHTTLEEDWEPSVEAVKESVQNNTRAIVLSYPSNPTGKVITPELFREIVEVANDHGVTVLSDEIYTDYVYKECPSILSNGSTNFVLTSSFSKTWAMTGFRIGYAVSSEEVIAKMMKIQSLLITSAPEFIQYGAIKAFGSDKEVEENARLMKERIEIASAALDKIDAVEYYKPDGAMYVFPRVMTPGFESTKFALELLEKKGVTTAPGTGFGKYPDCFRLSLGQSGETIAEGIRKIGEVLS